MKIKPTELAECRITRGEDTDIRDMGENLNRLQDDYIPKMLCYYKPSATKLKCKMHK